MSASSVCRQPEKRADVVSFPEAGSPLLRLHEQRHTLPDVGSPVLDRERLLDHVLAHDSLNAAFQRLQLGEAVHGEDVLVGGVGRDLVQLGPVGAFDPHRVNGDPGPAEVSGGVADVVLGFSVGDDHGHLLDAQLSPAASLLDEDLLLGELQGRSGLGPSSAVRQDFDEIQEFVLVPEGVEEDLGRGLVVVHDDAHPDPVGPDLQPADQRVQEGPHHLEVGGPDAPGLVDDEDDVGDVPGSAVCKQTRVLVRGRRGRPGVQRVGVSPSVTSITTSSFSRMVFR